MVATHSILRVSGGQKENGRYSDRISLVIVAVGTAPMGVGGGLAGGPASGASLPTHPIFINLLTPPGHPPHTALPFELIMLKYSCTTSSSLGSRGLPIRKYSNSASKPPRIDVLSEVYSKEKSWKIFVPPSKSLQDVVQVRM